jgi:hypothetical protein
MSIDAPIMERKEASLLPQKVTPCGCRRVNVPLDDRSIRKQGQWQFSLLPAFFLLLLPKCPLCVAAWCGVLGSMGLSSWLNSVWGKPLTVGLLGFSLGAIGFRALRMRNGCPMLLAGAGTALMYCGKAVVAVSALQFGGLAVLAAASVWCSWPKASKFRMAFASVDQGRKVQP